MPAHYPGARAATRGGAARRPAVIAILSRAITAPTTGTFVAVAVWLAIVAFCEPFGRLWGTGQDARSYWLPSLADPYRNSSWTEPLAYVYSPAFLQVVAPLTALAWPAFIGTWTAILLVAVRVLAGPRLFALGIVVAAMELAGGNISLLLALAIVGGFRWPALWSFVLLTKVTPGIALLWFAVRREWQSLAVAVIATAAVVLASWMVMPHAWKQWVDVLTANAGRNGTWAAVPVPLWARLPVAVAVVVWGARTDRRWTVPVAAMLALPALWYGSLSMLLAVIALRDDRGPAVARPAGRPRLAHWNARFAVRRRALLAIVPRIGRAESGTGQQGSRRAGLRSRGIALLLLLSSVFAACNGTVPGTIPSTGAGAPPTPSPSLAASPKPTRAPAKDLASLAAARLREFRSARVEITGQTTSGGRLTISGDGELAGDASRFAISMDAGEHRSSTVEVTVAEGRFWSRNGGPFVAEPVDADFVGLAAFLRDLGPLASAGTQVRDGRLLHRLVPPPTAVVPPSVLGLQGPGLEDFNAELEIYAEPNGTPVELAFEVAWRQPPTTGDQRVQMAVTYHLVRLDEPLTIQPPAEVWTTHVSDRFRYRIAYPEDWELEEVDDGDSFLGPDGSEAFIWMEPEAGSLNAWVTDAVLFYQEEFGQRPESNESVTIAGQAGRMLSYHAEVDEAPTFVMDALVVHEGRGYDLEWYSVPGNEAADRRTFQDMLSTVHVP